LLDHHRVKHGTFLTVVVFTPIAVRPRAQKGVGMDARVKEPAYYRARAEHYRALAKLISDPEMESLLLQFAQEFEAEALRAEEADTTTEGNGQDQSQG
jgi:hypothetical protein